MASRYERLAAAQRSQVQDAPASRYDRLAALQQGQGATQQPDLEPEETPKTFRTPGGQQRRFEAGADTSREWIDTEHAREGVDFPMIESRGGRSVTGKIPRASFAIPAEAKMTAQGTASFLESKFGRGSVYLDEQDRIFVLTPEERKKPLKEQKPVIYNRAGPSKTDLALAPLAVSGAAMGAAVAPSAAAAFGAGGVAGKALGVANLATAGVGSSLAQQAVAEALPGKEELSIGQRIGDAAISGLFEVAAPGVAKVVGASLSGAAKIIKLRSRWLSDFAERVIYRSNPAAVAEGARIEKEVGEYLGGQGAEPAKVFTSPQLSQSKAWLQTQGYFQVQPFAGSALNQKQQAAQETIKAIGTKVISDLGATGVSVEEGAKGAMDIYARELSGLGAATERVVSSLGKEGREGAAVGAIKQVESHMEALGKARKMVTKPYYERIDALADGKRVMPLTNALAEIDTLVSEKSSTLSSDAARKTVEWLGGVKSRLMAAAQQQVGAGGRATTPLVTADDFMNSLSDWGKKAVDSRGTIEGVADPKLNFEVATRMYRALLSDLEEAGTSPTMRSEVAGAIAEARALYKKTSIPINALADNPIVQFFDSPEKFVTWARSGDHSAETRAAFRLLDRIAPLSAGDMRAAYMRDVLKGVEDLNGVPKPEAIRKAVSNNIRTMAVVFEGAPQAFSEIRDIAAKAKKLQANPLRKHLGNNEKLITEFEKKNNAAARREIMDYVRASSPEAADKLSGSFVQKLLDAAGPKATEGTEAVTSPTAIVNTFEGNMDAIADMIGGTKKEALHQLQNMVDASRRVANMAGTGISPTQQRQAIGRVVELTVGGFATAGITAGLVQGDASTAAGGLAAPVLAILGSRWVAKAMANPKIAQQYAQVYRAAAQQGRLQADKQFRQQTKQALLDIASWYQREQARDAAE